VNRSLSLVSLKILASSPAKPGVRNCGRYRDELPKRRAKLFTGDRGESLEAAGFKYCVPLTASNPVADTVCGTPEMIVGPNTHCENSRSSLK